jgi:hypothetical protein
MQLTITDILFSLLGAWLFSLLFRGKDLVSLAKKEDQCTQEEKEKIKMGLVRSIVIEFFILVPASTTLILLILPLLLQIFARSIATEYSFMKSVDQRRAFYVMIGIISYNFPFAAVRQIATRIALNTIKEFYNQQFQPELNSLPKGKETV